MLSNLSEIIPLFYPLASRWKLPMFTDISFLLQLVARPFRRIRWTNSKSEFHVKLPKFCLPNTDLPKLLAKRFRISESKITKSYQRIKSTALKRIADLKSAELDGQLNEFTLLRCNQVARWI